MTTNVNEEAFLPKPKRTPYRDPKTGRFAKMPVPLTDLGRHLHKFVTTKG